MTVGNSGASFDKLAIVVGANGDLGNAYVQKICAMPGYGCVGLSIEPESRVSPLEQPNYHYLCTDMGNAHDVFTAGHQAAHFLNWHDGDPIKNVVLVYALGTARLELDRYSPTNEVENWPISDIDHRTMQSGVMGLRHLTHAIAASCAQKIYHAGRLGINIAINFRVAMFGSVHAARGLPFFRSRANADALMWHHLQNFAVADFNAPISMAATHVVVSPINTQTTRDMWPNATAERRESWLPPERVVRDSINQIMTQPTGTSSEMIISNAPPPKQKVDLQGIYWRLANESGKAIA
jgi:hypothetical protein